MSIIASVGCGVNSSIGMSVIIVSYDSVSHIIDVYLRKSEVQSSWGVPCRISKICDNIVIY